MRNFLSRLTDDGTSRIDLKAFLIFDAIAIAILTYSIAIMAYGVVVTNLVLVVVVASFTPEAYAVWKELGQTSSTSTSSFDTETAEPADGPIVIRHHWMMLAAPSAVLAFSMIVLFLHVTVVSDRLKLPYTILMVGAFGLMVGIPYVVTMVQYYRSLRQIPRATLIMRVAGIAGFLVAVLTIVYVLDDRGVSFDWFTGLLSFLGELIADIVRLITASQFNVLATIVILASVKWLIQFIDWHINPLELDGNLFTERTGIISRKPGSVRISDITDLKMTRFELTEKRLRFPWVRLRIDTAAQDQALTHVHWVPIRMYEELENCRNQQKGA